MNIREGSLPQSSIEEIAAILATGYIRQLQAHAKDQTSPLPAVASTDLAKGEYREPTPG